MVTFVFLCFRKIKSTIPIVVTSIVPPTTAPIITGLVFCLSVVLKVAAEVTGAAEEIIAEDPLS